MFVRMGRPSGETRRPNRLEVILTQAMSLQHRSLITRKIEGQTGAPHDQAGQPSAHLRWALQQMKTRGWTNEDWGQLFTDDGTLGDGPICMLEAVRAPFDAPGTLKYESIEQLYLRLAFKTLEVDPIPVYLSEWNDAQPTFEAVENVVLKAIELAEADERAGRSTPFAEFDEEGLRELLGVTEEAVTAAQDHLEAEKTQVAD